ncbi:transcription factor [Diatrype stigma]|uniref:Transcription factor n=1 Tax=Diatrype stigma TaxID=117547 RepID=A0AAN9YRY6_9PEZI
MVLPGSHIPFAPTRERVSSQQQQLHQYEHQRLVGLPQQGPQQAAFMIESPNLSTGSSTTPEVCPPGPLITPEDHPQQRPSSKLEKSRDNATTPTFQQYTVPPPPPLRKTTQQRQPRQQQQPRQRQRPSPAGAGIAAPDYTPSPHWQNLPDGDLATKTTAAALAMAPEGTAVVDVVEELRKCRNRVAANKCRQKKKASAAKLEGRNAALQQHNARLNTELGNLKREFAGLHDTLMGHFNCGDVNIQTYIQNRATSIATATPATTASAAVAAATQPGDRRSTRRYETMELPMFATQGASSMMTPTPNTDPSGMIRYAYETAPSYPLRSSISGMTTVETTTSSSSSSSPPAGELGSTQEQRQPQQHRQQGQHRTDAFPSAAAYIGGRTTSRVPIPALHQHHSAISTSSSADIPPNLHGLPSPPSMQLQPSPMITQRQYPFYHSGEVPLQAPFGSANAVFGGGHENNGQHGGGIQVYQHQHHQHGYHRSSSSSRHNQLEDSSMRCAGEEAGYHGDADDDDHGNGDDAGDGDGNGNGDGDGDGDNTDLGWGELLPAWEMPTITDSAR